MIQLELQPMETEVLVGALRSYLNDLHTEISHTDTREYREGLRSQQAVLEGLLRRIESTRNADATEPQHAGSPR